MELLLRSQTEMLADLQALMRDNGAVRWTAAEVYGAINRALGDWQGRVSLPALYAPASLAWSLTQYEYDLPSYINENRIQPQYLAPIYQPGVILPTNATTWLDLMGWTVEPTATGGRKLRFAQPPTNTAGRIIHWLTPTKIPTTVPTLSSSCAAGATSAVIGSVVDCDNVGWVKIDQECIGYSGVTRTASQTTLTNLVRAQCDTADVLHNSAAGVAFCVGYPRADVLGQLYDRAMAWMHTMFFQVAAPQERDVHGQMIRLFGQRADDFWRKWQPGRAPRMVLHSRAVMREVD